MPHTTFCRGRRYLPFREIQTQESSATTANAMGKDCVSVHLPDVRVAQSPSIYRVGNLAPGHDDPDDDCGDDHGNNHSNERVEVHGAAPKLSTRGSGYLNNPPVLGCRLTKKYRGEHANERQPYRPAHPIIRRADCQQLRQKGTRSHPATYRRLSTPSTSPCSQPEKRQNRNQREPPLSRSANLFVPTTLSVSIAAGAD